MFADDTSLFFTGSTSHEVEASANLYLSKLSGWLTKNKLKLNTQKTKFAMFRPINKHIRDNIIIYYNDQRIEQVNTQKFLGVWFHEHLSWTPVMEWHIFESCRVILMPINGLQKRRVLTMRHIISRRRQAD